MSTFSAAPRGGVTVKSEVIVTVRICMRVRWSKSERGSESKRWSERWSSVRGGLIVRVEVRGRGRVRVGGKGGVRSGEI